MLRNIFDEALCSKSSYEMLKRLCLEAPGRLTGSENAQKAIQIAAEMLRKVGADSVWLQPTWVPVWERGKGQLEYRLGNEPWQMLAFTELGGSVGTQGNWLSGPLVELAGMAALGQTPKNLVEGKIVFLNEAMDPRHINTFKAYGACGAQRVYGAEEAGKKGAKAVLVRSLSLGHDAHPHTGIMVYKSPPYIPGVALSVKDSERLSALLMEDSTLEIRLRLTCQRLDSILSYNVVGEWRGREIPKELVVVGGHLDSWDNAQGAHDDGAGVIHSIETLRILQTLNYRPRRSIRCVLFMNEESGARGAQTYADSAESEANQGVIHLAAIESDRGGFSPRGFSYEGLEPIESLGAKQLAEWLPLLKPYQLELLEPGGSGVDVSRLKKLGTFLIGLVPDSHRYFDVHHSPEDNVEKVHPRELALGSAAMASLAWLLAEHGLPILPDLLKD